MSASPVRHARLVYDDPRGQPELLVGWVEVAYVAGVASGNRANGE